MSKQPDTSIKVTIHRRQNYRMYPTPEQAELMRKNCGGSRYLYNELVKLGDEDLAAGRKIKKHSYTEFFATAPWLKELDACMLNTTLKDYERARARWREGKSRKPRKKSKKKTTPSYRTNCQTNCRTIYVKKNWLKLPKIKKMIKINKHRYLPQGCRITSATIIERTRGEWYVSLCYELEIELPRKLVIPIKGSELSTTRARYSTWTITVTLPT